MTGVEQAVQVGQQVVASNDGDGPILQPVAVEQRPRLGGAAGRVHSAGVGDDLEARLRLEARDEAVEDVEEIAGVAGLRVALLLQREDRHRQLGEVFERQVIEPALFREEARGVEVVARETTTVADADALHRDSPMGPVTATGCRSDYAVGRGLPSLGG